jgi:predicted GNAT superfamily acetyltransferase
MTGIVLRDLDGMAEFLAAEHLQSAVWGPGDKVDPGDLMMVIAAEGGLAAGAFREGRMLGYVFGFPTSDPRIQHSHRLATHPDARGLGLGVALKWYQRDWCLSRGIVQVRWTFDPMRHVNAGLNIGRLGGTAGTYYPDYYGAMPGINEGVPSDRLLVEWALDTDAVVRRAAGEPLPLLTGLRIPLDPGYARLLRTDLAAAMALRMALRDMLVARFAEGYRITGYDAKTCAYVLHQGLTAQA